MSDLAQHRVPVVPSFKLPTSVTATMTKPISSGFSAPSAALPAFAWARN